MGYQYALHQHKKKLLQEKIELRRSHESNSESSRSPWEEYSKTLESRKERHREPKNNRRRTRWSGKTSRSSFIAADEEENIMQETPEVALVAAQAYLLTTQPEPGDPQESMHQSAIKSFRLIGDELRKQ
jgi:hypothetical protein